jgi:hypothetical protein
MRIVRGALAVLLIAALAAPAGAQTLREAAARSARAAAASQSTGPERRPTAMIWTGAALFVGGMGVGLYAFINNKNGGFAEFGEANAVDKKLGAAGIASAFAGGTLLFMATRKATRAAPSVAVTPKGVTVSKRISW